MTDMARVAGSAAAGLASIASKLGMLSLQVYSLSIEPNSQWYLQRAYGCDNLVQSSYTAAAAVAAGLQRRGSCRRPHQQVPAALSFREAGSPRIEISAFS